MLRLWQSRAASLAHRYSDMAPAAPACCNVCRTCTTTNLVALVSGGAVALGAAAASVLKGWERRPPRRAAPRA